MEIELQDYEDGKPLIEPTSESLMKRIKTLK